MKRVRQTQPPLPVLVVRCVSFAPNTSRRAQYTQHAHTRTHSHTSHRHQDMFVCSGMARRVCTPIPRSSAAAPPKLVGKSTPNPLRPGRANAHCTPTTQHPTPTTPRPTPNTQHQSSSHHLFQTIQSLAVKFYSFTSDTSFSHHSTVTHPQPPTCATHRATVNRRLVLAARHDRAN